MAPKHARRGVSRHTSKRVRLATDDPVSSDTSTTDEDGSQTNRPPGARRSPPLEPFDNTPLHPFDQTPLQPFRPTYEELNEAHARSARLAAEIDRLQQQLLREKEDRERLFHQGEDFAKNTEAEHQKTVQELMRRLKDLGQDLHNAVERERHIREEAQKWLDYQNTELQRLQAEKQKLENENRQLPEYQEQQRQLNETLELVQRERAQYQANVEEYVRRLTHEYELRLQAMNANVASSSTTRPDADDNTNRELDRRIAEVDARLQEKREELERVENAVLHIVGAEGMKYLQESKQAWSDWLEGHQNIRRNLQMNMPNTVISEAVVPEAVHEYIRILQQAYTAMATQNLDLHVERIATEERQHRIQEELLEARQAHMRNDRQNLDRYLEAIDSNLGMRQQLRDVNRTLELYEMELEHAQRRLKLSDEETVEWNMLLAQRNNIISRYTDAARGAMRLSDDQINRLNDELREIKQRMRETETKLTERDDQLATARQKWNERDYNERVRMEMDADRITGELVAQEQLQREEQYHRMDTDTRQLNEQEQLRLLINRDREIIGLIHNEQEGRILTDAGASMGLRELVGRERTERPPPPPSPPPTPPTRGDFDPEKGDVPVDIENEFEEFMTTDATEAMVEPMTVAEERDVWADVSSHSSRESFRRRNDRPKKYVKHGRLDQPFEDQPTPTVPEPAPPPPPPPPLLPVPAGVRVDALGVPIPRQVDEMPVYVNPGLMKPLLPHNAPGWAKRNTDPVTKRRGTNSYTDQKRRQAGSTTSSEMDKMEVARAITLGDVPGPKPLKSIAYPLSGTRGRPRRMTFADTVDNLYATFANYVRSGRDITQATAYPTPERNDDDVVFYTLTNQRVNPQTGKVETLKDKSMSYTTTWGEFRKNPTFVQNLGDGRVVPVSFKYDPQRLTEPSNYSPVSKFFWFPGVRNNEWFRKRYYKPTGVRRGVHMTLKEAERLHDVLYHKFPMRWVGSSLQKQEDVANQKLDAEALAQLKKAQAKEKAEFAKKLFEAMQEAHMELGQEEADAVENRWRDENGNVFAFDEEDDEATSSPAPLPPVAVSDPTPVPPPPPPPIVAPTEAPAVLRTVGFEPPPTGSPSERPIVVRGDGVPGADVPVSSTTRTGPVVVNPFFALKAPIVPDTVGLLPESDSGSSTTLSSAPAPDPVPGPPPPPSVPTGGGEVAVGSSGPRDILDIPAERQGIFDRLHGAMTRAGIHGRMAQVRPPPPPPSPSPGPDDSSTKKYSLEDYIRDNGTTGDAYTDESNWQQYLQARRLGTRHTPHPPPTPPPPPI